MHRDVYFVTHTEAQHHVDGRVGGWFDSHLTTRGRDDARRVASELRRLIPAHEEPEVHSSDLRRAVETAHEIASVFETEVTEWPGLRELSYGAAEGRPDSWFRERFVPAPQSNRLDHSYGIEGAETKRQFIERTYTAIEAILERGARYSIIVGHGGALAPIVACWAKLPADTLGWIAASATPGGITHLAEDDFFSNRGIRALNHTSHL
jgi:2,3-bisphosphoglycerate-dependent phosphoglycerate mutase